MNTQKNRCTSRRSTRVTALVALPLVATLAVAGCGNDDDAGMGDHAGMSGMSGHMSGHASGSPSASSAAHNDQDVRFVEQMIPHHRQAVMMSRMAEGRAGSPQVRRLAQRIEAAQGPEIKKMSGWLDGWGIDGHHMGSMGGMKGMGSGSMPGMMSGREMAALHHTHGQQFDRLFLEGMIGHHRGAVRMADREIENGKAADVIDLARSIKTSQTREIALMRQMLQQLPAS